MKPHLKWAVYLLCFTVAVCCEAADSAPITLSCDTLQTSAVTDLGKRVEIVAQGFSVLPPQGEGWCYRALASRGGSFFKLPKFEKSFESLPSRDQIGALHIFSAIALSLAGFRDSAAKIKSPDELESVVNLLITEHLFSQILDGVQSAEHRFRLLESNTVSGTFLGARCVRFNATVEERGNVQAPDLVFLLNLTANVVCVHPTAPDNDLIWIGFGERYVQGDQPASDALKGEYEPFVQSLRFMPPR
jgi:hypothetical protein